jgi:hypothetical protein
MASQRWKLAHLQRRVRGQLCAAGRAPTGLDHTPHAQAVSAVYKEIAFREVELDVNYLQYWVPPCCLTGRFDHMPSRAFPAHHRGLLAAVEQAQGTTESKYAIQGAVVSRTPWPGPRCCRRSNTKPGPAPPPRALPTPPTAPVPSRRLHQHRDRLLFAPPNSTPVHLAAGGGSHRQ